MSAKDDDSETEVQALLASTQMDNTADYLARGREYQHLVQDELLGAWVRAFKTMVGTGIPGGPAARQRERDLAAEIKLRGIEPPYSDVKDAVERFCSDVMARVESDPEALQRVTDSLESYFVELWSKPKN
jgi:hypothetical protein